MVCAKGKYVCIASTTAEGKGTVDKELAPALGLFDTGAVVAKFDSSAEMYAAQAEAPKDGVFCTGSYDATTHFESVMEDVARMWTLLTGEKIKDFKVPTPEEAAAAAAAAASGDGAAAASASASSA
jgi:Rab GDP dissociation inhibitor